MNINFSDRVVVITGAGGGIGQQYARDFAARGAKIVANDIGAGLDGRGFSSDVIEKLLEDIQSAGGTAIGNCDSIVTQEGADALIRAAMDAFGRVDVVINNAGTTRNNLIADMSPEDFRAVLDVHLFGSFHVTRAAWPTLMQQGYGRVLMTTSQSGFYGMETHANYAAAKAALVGLGHALSHEGRGKGILVNTICPMATTRMSEEFLTPEQAQRMHPKSVSAMAMWLCSEECQLTDQVVEAGMGYFAKVETVEAKGIVIDPVDASPEYLQAHYEQISDMTGATGFASVADFLEKVSIRVFAPAPAQR